MKFRKSSITPAVAKALKGTNVEKYVYDNLDEKVEVKPEKEVAAKTSNVVEAKPEEKTDFSKMKKAELLEFVGHDEEIDGKITVKELIVLAEKK